MPLILAAAGKGTRLGALTAITPKALVREPFQGRAILDHLFERIERDGPLGQVVIVGGDNPAFNRQLIEFARSYPFRSPTESHLVTGERRGVGHAFLLGVEKLKALGGADACLSVADSVAVSYTALRRAGEAIAVGVTAMDPETDKRFTTVQVDRSGLVLPEGASAGAESARILRGVYQLRGEALAEYARRMRFGMTHRSGDSQVCNDKGEFRVTWLWREMQQAGAPIRGAELGGMVEVNFPEDLRKFRKLVG